MRCSSLPCSRVSALNSGVIFRPAPGAGAAMTGATRLSEGDGVFRRDTLCLTGTTHGKPMIVWFIAIALPVQGMAGLTMAHCAPSHERMGAAAQVIAHQHADQDAGVAHHHNGDAADDATLKIDSLAID